ncbi:hypothetical protein CBS101457_000216 [Exobasidium rhododendri]|nr:hypothetical protein CBS101457_000216 [Exobasidium rhododendri]
MHPAPSTSTHDPLEWLERLAPQLDAYNEDSRPMYLASTDNNGIYSPAHSPFTYDGQYWHRSNFPTEHYNDTPRPMQEVAVDISNMYVDTPRPFRAPTGLELHSDQVSTQLYRGPWEYTLQVDATFPPHLSSELLYKKLSDDQRVFIIDTIHQIKPHKAGSIRRKLSDRLDSRLARGLLSKDDDTIDEAVRILYSAGGRKKMNYGVTWMDNLSKEKKISVVEKLAEATQQGADEVRDLLLSHKVTPEAAARILIAPLHECRSLARVLDLFLPEQEALKIKPWSRGTSHLQRRALLQRMARLGARLGFTDESYCVALMNAISPPGYGLKMLRTSDENFLEALRWIKAPYKRDPPVLPQRDM